MDQAIYLESTTVTFKLLTYYFPDCEISFAQHSTMCIGSIGRRGGANSWEFNSNEAVQSELLVFWH